MIAIVAPLLLSLAAASTTPAKRGGRQDFDLEFGAWRVHHRTLAKDGTRVELAGGSTAARTARWIRRCGAASTAPFMTFASRDR